MRAAFLFDLDGTLIDSIELIRSSYLHTLRHYELPVMSEEDWLDGLGRPLAWQFGKYSQDAARIEAMIATYRVHNLEHHDRMVRGFPGIAQALIELKQSGGRLAVVTSKLRKSALHGLARSGLDAMFEVVVGMDDVTRHKPEPEPVLRALEHLGCAPEQAIMVGDSPHDLAAGRAAGTATAAVLWGPFPRSRLERERPDVWLAHPREIGALGRGFPSPTPPGGATTPPGAPPTPATTRRT